MTETTQKTINNPIVRQDLVIRMLLIKAGNRTLKLNQQKIARAIRCDQSSVSLAMRNPERSPNVAKKIEKYFDRIESSRNKITTPESGIHA